MGTEQKLTDQVYLPLLQVMRLKAHTTPRTCELLKKGKKITARRKFQKPRVGGSLGTGHGSPLGCGMSCDSILRIDWGMPKVAIKLTSVIMLRKLWYKWKRS